MLIFKVIIIVVILIRFQKHCADAIVNLMLLSMSFSIELSKCYLYENDYDRSYHLPTRRPCIDCYVKCLVLIS